jgi:hypothetical protein
VSDTEETRTDLQRDSKLPYCPVTKGPCPGNAAGVPCVESCMSEEVEETPPTLGTLLRENGMGNVTPIPPPPISTAFIDGNYYYRHGWENMDVIPKSDLFGRVNLILDGEDGAALAGACLPIENALMLRDFLVRELSKAQCFRTGLLEFLTSDEEDVSEMQRDYSTAVAFIALDKIVGMAVQVFAWPEGGQQVLLRVRH